MPVRDPNFAIYERRNRAYIPALAGVSGYPTEEHTFEVGLTQYPIESGSSLTDNAVRRQTKIRLEGRVTDLLPGFAPGTPEVIWSNIFNLAESRAPVVVFTGLRTYENMVLTRASAPVDRTTGKSLHFSLELTEVLFAESELVRIAPDAVLPTGPAADRTSLLDGGERGLFDPFSDPFVEGIAGVSLHPSLIVGSFPTRTAQPTTVPEVSDIDVGDETPSYQEYWNQALGFGSNVLDDVIEFVEENTGIDVESTLQIAGELLVGGGDDN